jgi:glycosyltransferase involved in cell wall biosynthesis
MEILQLPASPESTVYPGRCILHKPLLGDTLPVYVRDRYEEFARVIPMVEMTNDEIEDYIAWNSNVVTRVVQENGVTAMHANHSVLMAQVAMRVSADTAVPFAIMPHGSAIEYAVKRDERFRTRAEAAFNAAHRIFVHGEEMRDRVRSALPHVVGMESKFVDLHLGVDTSQFEPASRAEKPARIDALIRALQDLPRGRTTSHTEQLRESLRADQSVDELLDAMDAVRTYDNKTPDADLEGRLEDVDWQSEPTLLYVGRLISTKGIQGVLAAMPLLLARKPAMRLIIVGHGPLREVMEAMTWAMEHGHIDLLERIADHGRTLEHSPQGDSGGTSLTQVRYFLDQVRDRGSLQAYREAGMLHMRRDRVLFTGYLTHRELRSLFPCCDASIFPSVIREAGPLVFLEALASGSFPLGTYFGGMRESIDAVSDVLPPEATEVMKLSPDPHRTVSDIVRNAPLALEMGDRFNSTLYNFARERYDWTSVADMFHSELEAM